MTKDNNSSKFTIASALLLLLGFLGYRKMSGERNIVMKGEIVKGENKNDKTSVELGNAKTELSPEAILPNDQAFKTVVLRMIKEPGDVTSMEDFKSKFILLSMRLYVTSKEMVKRIPKSDEAFDAFLERTDLKDSVHKFINYCVSDRKEVLIEGASGLIPTARREFRTSLSETGGGGDSNPRRIILL